MLILIKLLRTAPHHGNFPSLCFEQYTLNGHASYLTLRLFQPTYSWRLVSVSPNLKPSTSPGLIVSTSTFDGRRHFSSGATVTSLVDSSALNIKQKSVSKVSSTLSKDLKCFLYYHNKCCRSTLISCHIFLFKVMNGLGDMLRRILIHDDITQH